MNTVVGILMFETVNELDFLGPYEVLSNSNYILRVPIFPPDVKLSPDTIEVRLVSKNGGYVTCEKGLQVKVPYSFSECQTLDVLVIPGGSGVDAVCADNEQLQWIKDVSKRCQWITSVCNGVFVLASAGLARDKRVTTHWAALEMLRQTKLAGTVVEGVQFVRDGNLVTSAGVSAGIDMALWLLGQITTPDRARLVQKTMQYNPAPPYTAEI
jgi:transcriptional regulator GlxA family with amidase domain